MALDIEALSRFAKAASVFSEQLEIPELPAPTVATFPGTIGAIQPPDIAPDLYRVANKLREALLTVSTLSEQYLQLRAKNATRE